MAGQYLDFEEPIIELEKKIAELKSLSKNNGVDFSGEIRRLHRKANRLKDSLLSRLTRWQRTQLARHPSRPYAMDYISMMTEDFMELHGDRHFGDCHSIVGGIARLEEWSVFIIGHQKGRDLKEKMYRNFGMPQPEGYRKALRLMKFAEKFGKPIITLLDTPGAYPGIGAEERGQAEAIARNLIEMANISVPIIVVVIGEGGSGGALALGVGNRVLMLEHSVYSVISPEGCAAILWEDCKKVEEAAEALCLTSDDLFKLGVIDEIIKEPLGGAHRNPAATAGILRRVLRRHLQELTSIPPKDLVEQRREKFRNMGAFKER
ncbi:MAG: acetyl-CoA carboxylase carboxyltransferase subunit alpha [Nitrospinae bacterium]|nr:acetyl-CoA carboxylase carboxyltransferase subunit alpha [Nitrospinota bacterium]